MSFQSLGFRTRENKTNCWAGCWVWMKSLRQGHLPMSQAQWHRVWAWPRDRGRNVHVNPRLSRGPAQALLGSLARGPPLPLTVCFLWPLEGTLFHEGHVSFSHATRPPSPWQGGTQWPWWHLTGLLSHWETRSVSVASRETGGQSRGRCLNEPRRGSNTSLRECFCVFSRGGF